MLCHWCHSASNNMEIMPIIYLGKTSKYQSGHWLVSSLFFTYCWKWHCDTETSNDALMLPARKVMSCWLSHRSHTKIEKVINSHPLLFQQMLAITSWYPCWYVNMMLIPQCQFLGANNDGNIIPNVYNSHTSKLVRPLSIESLICFSQCWKCTVTPMQVMMLWSWCYGTSNDSDIMLT